MPALSFHHHSYISSHHAIAGIHSMPPSPIRTTMGSITTTTLPSIKTTRTPLPFTIRTATVRCMANPRRVKMVARQIQRELSDMLLTDKVLQFAILPEAALGADKYLSSLTTISDVQVSSDLQVVKVYVSVFGDDRGKEVAIAGLKSKAKYVRSELGKRMKLRLTPEVRFIEDEAMERGSRVIAILDKIKAEKETDKRHNEQQGESSDWPEENKDWNADNPDEDDIIYVD